MQRLVILLLLSLWAIVTRGREGSNDLFRKYNKWLLLLQSNLTSSALTRHVMPSSKKKHNRSPSFRSQSDQSFGYLLQYYYASGTKTGCQAGTEFYVSGFLTNTCLTSEKGDTSLMLSCSSGRSRFFIHSGLLVVATICLCVSICT
ncbi:hypothetical protein EON64_21310 [archaeon]|nr:MAG: hypothetical protein EON64_21310 [archaeon]